MQYENMESLSKAISSYTKYFLTIPNDFNVLEDYLLDGISKLDFNIAFKDYRDLITSIYDDMANNPVVYSFVTTDKKGNFKNTKQPIQCIVWLMYALGKSGEIRDRTLYVSSEMINNIFAGKHDCDITGINNSIINRDNLFQKLIQFGFEFSITDFDHFENDFNLMIPQNPNIVVALKAFTLSRFSDQSFNCDYAGFNYHVFSVGYNDRLPYHDLYISKSASEKTKIYVETLINELSKLGYEYINIRHHGFVSNVWMYKCCFFYQRGDYIQLNLPIHYVPKHNRQAYLEHIKTMPEKYQRKHCDGCRHDPQCKSMVFEIINNKKQVYCADANIGNLNQIEDIPYVVELIKVMFQPKVK